MILLRELASTGAINIKTPSANQNIRPKRDRLSQRIAGIAVHALDGVNIGFRSKRDKARELGGAVTVLIDIGLGLFSCRNPMDPVASRLEKGMRIKAGVDDSDANSFTGQSVRVRGFGTENS
jgi:hypothetical protein